MMKKLSFFFCFIGITLGLLSSCRLSTSEATVATPEDEPSSRVPTEPSPSPSASSQSSEKEDATIFHEIFETLIEQRAPEKAYPQAGVSKLKDKPGQTNKVYEKMSLGKEGQTTQKFYLEEETPYRLIPLKRNDLKKSWFKDPLEYDNSVVGDTFYLIVFEATYFPYQETKEGQKVTVDPLEKSPGVYLDGKVFSSTVNRSAQDAFSQVRKKIGKINKDPRVIEQILDKEKKTTQRYHKILIFEEEEDQDRGKLKVLKAGSPLLK